MTLIEQGRMPGFCSAKLQCTQMVQTLPTKSTREEEYWRTVSSRKTLSICGMCTFLSCRTTTIRIHRKSQSFKLHDRTQAGPLKEPQCEHARKNVCTKNESAKGQKSFARPSVTRQQLDLARLNLEGQVAYSFSRVFAHRCIMLSCMAF